MDPKPELSNLSLDKDQYDLQNRMDPIHFLTENHICVLSGDICFFPFPQKK